MTTPSVSKTMNSIFGAIMALLVAIQTWEVKEIVDIEAKIGLMQGNKFTSADGLEVWKEISVIKSSLAQLPNQYPPKWFIDRVDKMDKKLDDLAFSLDSYNKDLLATKTELKNHELYDSKVFADSKKGNP